MMPREGNYRLWRLTPTEFGAHVRDAHREGTLRSYIGYQQTADLVARLAGVPIAVSRDSTLVEDGDKLLICRLRYRVAPGSKGEQQPEDFEFFACAYSVS